MRIRLTTPTSFTEKITLITTGFCIPSFATEISIVIVVIAPYFHENALTA